MPNRMITTVIVIVVLAAILGGCSYFNSKEKPASKPIATVGVKRDALYMATEEAAKMVDHLQELGYFKYADIVNVDKAKKELIESISKYGIISEVVDEKTDKPLDPRFFGLDGETLFEQDGFTDMFKELEPLFNKMDFKFKISNHVEHYDKWLNHRITVNGKEYLIFKNFKGHGWGEAAQRFAEILNDQLQLQGNDELLYLVNGANDGSAVFLTNDQYQFIRQKLKDKQWIPLPIGEWCKEFEVDPKKYLGQ
jgi:hypothetical protein